MDYIWHLVQHQNQLAAYIIKTYFHHSIILALFDFLRNLMCYFVHLYVELYTSKNYKKLILLKYAIKVKRFHE